MSVVYVFATIRGELKIVKSTWKLKHANSILVFWIFLPNFIKIDPYNFELYRFKVGTSFWDSVVHLTTRLWADGLYASYKVVGLVHA